MSLTMDSAGSGGTQPHLPIPSLFFSRLRFASLAPEFPLPEPSGTALATHPLHTLRSFGTQERQGTSASSLHSYSALHRERTLPH